MAAETRTLQISQVRTKRRTKRRVNVHVLVPMTMINNVVYPIIPDTASELFVREWEGQYQYYTQAELEAAAKKGNWQVEKIGYAAVLNNELVLYTNDPADPANYMYFEQFKDWYLDGLQRLEQHFSSPEVPVETVINQPPQPIISADLRRLVIAILLIVAFGNIAQILIAIVK